VSSETIHVRVFGADLPVRVKGDPERAREVAARVDERMRAISRGAGVASVQSVAILTALNFADELDRASGGAVSKRGDVAAQRVDALTWRLDEALRDADSVLAGDGSGGSGSGSEERAEEP
jgi:cell division protein ZapA (FtsZ GTPase activity inhibitor)